ncbi:hypothetical protein M153_1100019555 [Pseudoloma neurophilia]|uniref:Uncharacterized protein n=1 Tax=Pseudoloma neurophilia TaxID=146866 RepID=A0A0R0M8A6_9MICR|nr:hypothetical protein M153_1100019555 [Pseudoloma neurophilia]
MAKIAIVYTHFKQPIRFIEKILQNGMSLENLVLIRVQTVNINLLNYMGGKEMQNIHKRRNMLYEKELRCIAEGISNLLGQMSNPTDDYEIPDQETIPCHILKLISTKTIFSVCKESELQKTLNFYRPNLVALNREMYKKFDIEKFDLLLMNR